MDVMILSTVGTGQTSACMYYVHRSTFSLEE
jgi:hypothetical protein